VAVNGSPWKFSVAGLAASSHYSGMSKRPLLPEMSRHSSLMLWLMENRAEFAASLSKSGQPSWKRIAVAMADLGLRDVNGNKPAPETVLKTWKRILAKPRKLSNYDKLANLANLPKPAQPEPTPTGDAAARRERLREQTNRRSIR
jgi:hypothetical protein